MTETLDHDFESYAAGRYPAHHRRLVASRRALRFVFLKAVAGALLFVGAPLSGVILGGRLLLEKNAASFQDGARPVPFLAELDLYTQIVIMALLLVVTFLGLALGWGRKVRLLLAIEDDTMRLRTAFLLDEWADTRSLSGGALRVTTPREREVLIKRPNVSPDVGSSTADDFPPLTGDESGDRDGPSVAPGDFSLPPARANRSR